jgi:predicted ATPase
MRIAVSGTHRAGKSTLVEALSAALPNYDALDEPYHQLEEEGHEFAEVPSIEDFEQQLERSIECIEHSAANTIFDRSPADFLGYLLTHSDSDRFDLSDWLPRVQAAVEKLDLVVFVPIEAPDRIVLPRSESRRERSQMNAALTEIVLDDRYGFEVEVLRVAGTPDARLQQVLARLRNTGL